MMIVEVEDLSAKYEYGIENVVSLLSVSETEQPEAPGLLEFYPNLATLELDGHDPGISVVRTRRVFSQEPITKIEYHIFADEGILPLDGDIVILVGCPTGPDDPSVSDLHAVLVPAGVFVSLLAKARHSPPMSLDDKAVHVMIILPEDTPEMDYEVTKLAEGVCIRNPIDKSKPETSSRSGIDVTPRRYQPGFRPRDDDELGGGEWTGAPARPPGG